jgi:hypothetical protein
MNISLRRLLITGILITGILLTANNVLAVTAEEPFLDFTANFSYNDGARGKAATKYLLTFSSWNITGGNYIDGTYFGEGSDPITSAYFVIGDLYNDDYNQNLIFGNTNNGGTGAGGVTGPVSFTITDGTTTYFSATLDNFIITDDLFGTRLNPYWDLNNITNPTFNANGSQYIQELQARYNDGWKINFGMDFTFTSGNSGGGYAFTNDASGTIQGEMAVTPEPVSSILFVTGGATLAFRRYLKKRKNNNFYGGLK